MLREEENKSSDSTNGKIVIVWFRFCYMPADHFHMPLLGKREINGKYLVFTLDAGGSGYSFRAGKYATVSLPAVEEKQQSRIFSIASSPNDPDTLRFGTIMREGSDFKEVLRNTSEGTLIDVSPPSGGFFLISDRSRPVVFITSEIGVTPVISIVKWAFEQGIEQRIKLLYMNGSPEDELFMEEFGKIAGSMKSMCIMNRILPLKSGNSGLDSISRCIGECISDSEAEEAMFYISGKPSFVLEARKAVREMGVGTASTKVESFSGY